jgi:hypothetical protein
MVYGGGGLYGVNLRYSLGVFNGVQDGYGEVDRAKDAAARFTLNPFPSDTFDLNLTFAWTGGNNDGPLSGFKVTDESVTSILSFVPAARYDGWRWRRSFEAELLWRNVAVGAEHIVQSSEITDGALATRRYEMAGSSAWAAWILTGEKKSREDWLVPASGWGAFELVARYTHFKADRALAGLTTPGRFTREADQITVGVNWYQTRFARVMIDVQRSRYDDPIEARPGVLKDAHTAILLGLDVRF